MALVYKIISAEGWRQARLAGVFLGAAIDLGDGYIHLSDDSQVEETARRHFSGQNDLLLVAFEADILKNLKWEPSRGGALFPHVYGTIDPRAALWAKPLAFKDGAFEFPEGWRG
jgi:uncharacterized protein (DUF952 family)